MATTILTLVSCTKNFESIQYYILVKERFTSYLFVGLGLVATPVLFIVLIDDFLTHLVKYQSQMWFFFNQGQRPTKEFRLSGVDYISKDCWTNMRTQVKRTQKENPNVLIRLNTEYD
jgi:hypothetical protein